MHINSGYQCKKCGNNYFLRDGYVDFLGDVEFYAGEVSQQEMHSLIAEIDSLGYTQALAEFFRRHPSLQDYVTDTRRADWLCHSAGKIKLRCLDIGSGLGNISELLSYTYQQVYSLEAVRERIEFQKRRYKNSTRENITIARGNASELPFPDNYFDLVACNGVMEWIGMMNTSLPPRQAQLSFLYELRRVLSDEGCLYIGIENRFGLPFLLGAKDHSGLPYTSVVPRRVANFMVRKFGYSGGVYGDKSKREKEKRGYYTYTYSISGYKSLFRKAGFKFKSYWVIPSYNEPYNSGRLDDKIGLKGYIRYFKNSTEGRFRLLFLLSTLEKLDKSILALFASLFSPSFLFYCYKNELGESLDEVIASNTKLKNYTTMSAGTAIRYVLYDKKAEPLKVVHLRRDGYQIPKNIPFHEKTKPAVSQDLPETIWIENWIVATKINPLKVHEAQMAIEWLINFQNKNQLTPLTEDDISLEANTIREHLSRVSYLETARYLKCIDNYESYVKSLNVRKTFEHGDFFYRNILLDPTTRKITVIDWEKFRESGNPFYDFAFFFITSMGYPNESEEEFRSNLSGAGKFSGILRELEVKINAHFGFEVNFGIVIPYVILRFIVRKFLESGTHDRTFIQYHKMLNILLA